MNSKPKIAFTPNGPYYLMHDMQAKPVPNLCRASGEACATVRGIALCRCGASKNKPFCDGTHGTIGFSSENKTTTTNTNTTNYNGHTSSNGSGEKIIKDKRKSYVGKKITIHDNRRICSHAAECV